MTNAAGTAEYTTTMHSLDPLGLRGCQTRARIFIVLVRNDVNRNRGPFTIPTLPKSIMQSRNLISILDPVAEVMPATAARKGAKTYGEWKAFVRERASDHPVTARAAYARTTAG
jgi:hypothetical protein